MNTRVLVLYCLLVTALLIKGWVEAQQAKGVRHTRESGYPDSID